MFCACSSDIEAPAGGADGKSLDAVSFSPSVKTSSADAPTTRATTEETDTFELDNDPHWDDFYIYMNIASEGYNQYGTYAVPSNATGQFDFTDISADGATKLNWRNSSDTHQFISWNIPSFSDRSGTEFVEMSADNVTGKVHFCYPEARKENGSSFKAADNFFCRRLEYFLGTRTQPLVYDTNGVSVAMLFKHLVSKIEFENITLTQSDGSTKNIFVHGWFPNTDIYTSFEINFPDMPQTATLHTGIGSGEDFDPYIEADANGVKGVKNYGTVWSGKGLYMYFPPFDFADYGDFVVTLTKKDGNGNTAAHKYYGSLQELIKNNAFDDLERTGIAAGEFMKLNLHLADGKVTGVSAYIADWDDVDAGTYSVPVKKGVYSLDDLKDMAYEDAWADYADENGVIHIYNNIAVSELEEAYEIPDGYTIEGLGHNISGGHFPFYPSSSITNLYVKDEYVYTETTEKGLLTYADLYDLFNHKSHTDTYADENKVIKLLGNVTIPSSMTGNYWMKIANGYTFDANGFNIITEGKITVYQNETIFYTTE